MVLFENVHAFNVRSETRSAFRIPLGANRLLIGAVVLAQGIHIASMFIPGWSGVLEIEPVAFTTWLALLGITLSKFAIVEAYKHFRGRPLAERINNRPSRREARGTSRAAGAGRRGEYGPFGAEPAGRAERARDAGRAERAGDAVARADHGKEAGIAGETGRGESGAVQERADRAISLFGIAFSTFLIVEAFRRLRDRAQAERDHRQTSRNDQRAGGAGTGAGQHREGGAAGADRAARMATDNADDRAEMVVSPDGADRSQPQDATDRTAPDGHPHKEKRR